MNGHSEENIEAVEAVETTTVAESNTTDETTTVEDFHVPTDAEVAKYYVKGRSSEHAETEVLRWLVSERKRVGSFATAKTVHMIIGLLKANLTDCTCTDFECADCEHDLWYTDAIELIEKEFGTKS